VSQCDCKRELFGEGAKTKEEKKEMVRGANMIDVHIYIFIYITKPTKNCSKKEGESVKKE
jgi:hypothetical protein